MVAETRDDEVISLDDVFHGEDEVISLALSAEEWEVIIALAEAGGTCSLRELHEKVQVDTAPFQQVLQSLLERAILAKGAAIHPSDAAVAPDAEVAQYLEYLQDLNYYQVLQLNPEADAGDVRRGYFRLMREYHPDRFMKEKNPDTRENLKEIFRTLTRAYETISDPDLRHDYDLTIPEFTGAEEKEDELAFNTLWAEPASPETLPETNPDLAKSFHENALDDFNKGDYLTAQLNFKLAVALDPDQDDYKAGLAKTRRILNKKNAKDSAIKAFYFEEEKKYRAAIRLMHRAAELDQERPDYRFDLARMIEAYDSDLHSARTHILLALDRDTKNTEYLILLAKIQERLAEIPDARRTYKKILAHDKNNPAAKKALERLKK